MIGLDAVHEREIVLNGFRNVNGLSWTADGKGWFMVVNTSLGHRLMLVGRDGRASDLERRGMPSLRRTGRESSSPAA